MPHFCKPVLPSFFSPSPRDPKKILYFINKLLVTTCTTMVRPKNTNQPKQRHSITNEQRQKIRKCRKDNQLWSQADLLQWAENEFGRKLSQSTMSEICSQKWAFLDDKRLTATCQICRA